MPDPFYRKVIQRDSAYSSMWQESFKVANPIHLLIGQKKLLREAGLSEDLHLHSLRHTLVTLGIEKNSMSIREMQNYMDHSSVTITEHYAHEKARRTPKIGL